MKSMFIELNEVIFGYGNRPVVQAKNLRLHPGQCLGIFGPNGAGKTTLVRGITGLLPPMNGKVLRDARLRFGYLPQHRALQFHWPMTGADAASIAISAYRRFGWVGRDRSRVKEAMRLMSVEDLARKPFSKLSGGQQQRLLLAGALAAEPQILVLDEPTDGLDARSRSVLLCALQAAKTKGLCCVVISHDVQDLLILSDEIAWLHAADEADQPSSIERISPDECAGRMSALRQTVAK